MVFSATTNGSKDNEANGNFLIKRDNAKNLTDFQRKKAEYFFNVNFRKTLKHLCVEYKSMILYFRS